MGADRGRNAEAVSRSSYTKRGYTPARRPRSLKVKAYEDGRKPSKSRTRGDASSSRTQSGKVTETTSSRGGAVCLPFAFIPKPVRPLELNSSLAGLIFIFKKG